MNFSNKIPIALIGTVATIVIAQPTAVFAISADEVGKIAKSITVLIDSKNPGSGIIIKRNGNTYTVLTARHVFKDAQAKYEIVTPDDKRYLLNYSSVKKLPNIDLAVVEFTSSQTYSVAKIGNSDLATEGKAAYVAGFPKTSAAINTSIYNFTDGRITANASRPLEDGYALVYSNNTLPGMSGGPVLNENGEVVGIHGRADTRAAESSSINQNIQIAKTGFNLGIPINTSLRLLASSQVDLGVKVPSAPVVTGLKADNFYVQGGEKYQKKDYEGAIAAYSQAIQLNPNYVEAYKSRGDARSELQDNQGAIADYNKALQINPNYASSYLGRGTVRGTLRDERGAMADFNEALRINPNYAEAYLKRGTYRYYRLKDKQGGIEDVNQGIRLNPNSQYAYFLRSYLREEKDYQGLIEDMSEMIRINPKSQTGYNGRAQARYKLGDKQGALADYNEALRLNPNWVIVYEYRGIVRSELGDRQGAIADLDRVVQMTPNYASGYYSRGIVRSELGDKQGAIQDFQKAAYLYQQQGGYEGRTYQDPLNRIRELQNNTPTQPTSTTLLSANSSLIPGKSSAFPSGSLYELHTFEGRADQLVTITVESRDFDTYFALLTPDGKLLGENDNISKSNSNSAVTLTLPYSGRYRVIVTTVEKGGRGRYTLTIR
jgi:tetratricopeptide (TPR) repeat protein